MSDSIAEISKFSLLRVCYVSTRSSNVTSDALFEGSCSLPFSARNLPLHRESTTIWWRWLASCSQPNIKGHAAHFERCPVRVHTLRGKELSLSGCTWVSLPLLQEGKPEGAVCTLYFSARPEYSGSQVYLHCGVCSVTAFRFLGVRTTCFLSVPHFYPLPFSLCHQHQRSPESGFSLLH